MENLEKKYNEINIPIWKDHLRNMEKELEWYTPNIKSGTTHYAMTLEPRHHEDLYITMKTCMYYLNETDSPIKWGLQIFCGNKNVEFIKGDIEEMPIESDSINVVVSNCVLNLVPDKKKAFSEIFRVLKTNAHFSVSDVVLLGDLPEKLKESAEMYAGCVSGAIQKTEYLQFIEDAGFVNIKVQKEKEIIIPTDILETYLSPTQMEEYRNMEIGIFSVTVYAEKPAACCTPGGNCC